MEQAQSNVTRPGIACYRCGGPMRFVSSEPHPVEAGVDLHTYGCGRCDFVQVLTVAGPRQSAA